MSVRTTQQQLHLPTHSTLRMMHYTSANYALNLGAGLRARSVLVSSAHTSLSRFTMRMEKGSKACRPDIESACELVTFDETSNICNARHMQTRKGIQHVAFNAVGICNHQPSVHLKTDLAEQGSRKISTTMRATFLSQYSLPSLLQTVHHCSEYA